MNGRSIVTGGAALLLAFLLFVAGIALVTAEQQQQSTSSNTATGTLDAAALPVAAQQWIPYIEQAGELCPQITAPLLAAQEEVESGFNPKAVSPAGAEGIAQFLPSTWTTWSRPPATTGPDTPFNAPDAILGEGRYMCALATQMADLAQSSGTDIVSLTLAAYNAGSAAVAACGCVPDNGQTAQYVAKVEALEATFTAVLTSAGGGNGFAKGTVWQTDDIIASAGGSYDVSNPNVAAAITKDADDMQNAGVTWSRWWVGPGLTAGQVTTTVSIFARHGISVDLDVNAGRNSDPGTEATLKGWLAQVVPAVAVLGNHFWEIGNEPNLSDYWDTCGGLNAAVASYLVRLRDASTTIRRFDPDAFISSAGISYNPSYTARCAITSDAWFRVLDGTDAASLIDCVGIHPYASSAGGVVAALEDTRTALAGGLAAKPFCVTEVGFWSTGFAHDQNGEVSSDENVRAADYTALMSALKSYGISTPVFWYTWYDGHSRAGYGIVAYGGFTARTYLPIYAAVRAYTVPAPAPVLASSSGGPAGLGTPLPCPADAVQVSPGNVPGIRADTNYCFAAGTYGGFSVTPQTDDGFYGGGRAVMQGGGTGAAFSTNNASDVVVDGFTITGYRPPGDYFQAPGAVEFLHGSNITVSDNTIEDDSGTAVSFSNSGVPCCNVRNGGVNDSTITHNVITNIGYSGTVISSGTDDTVSYNDVSHTDGNGANTENDVAAVGKFALVSGTKVIGNNVHDNTDTAIWFDVYDTDSTIEDNTVTNDRVGIFYEISCNAVISSNTITDVGFDDARAGAAAWGAAIRISSSGAGTQPPCSEFGAMPGPNGITITNNTMADNQDAIVLFDGHPDPVNSVTVMANTISGTAIGTPIIDAEPGRNNIYGNNTNGATTVAQPVLAAATGPTAFGAAVVEAAAAELGVAYSWGGGTDAGPSLGIAQGAGTVGFDCSGLVLYAVWKASGDTIQLPHSSEVQATLGESVSKADIEPGDVIAFTLDGSSDFDHVGIYVGDDEMIDAPQTDGVVRIDDLGSSYWQSVPSAIRSFG